jgi:hypothetical protein
MSNLDPTTQMLLLLLACSAVVLFILVIIYIVLKAKEKKTFDRNDENIESDKKSTEKHTTQALGKKSIFDFMEFDKIEDNMIIQRNGRKYIMAVECQGVNYDLMSGVEKTGVEEGFVQFLNTLRFPIQIYVQTRTVNLESSLDAYKKRVSQIEANLYKMNQQYEEMVDSERYTKEQLNKAFYEITKQRNLYEYGKDIIYDTEKMSLNKNILNKKYFIIISYSPNEIGENEYDKSEIQSMAFSELYTRAQSLMRTISACGVNGKILNSVELAELLYVAYNRDESETFDLKKAAKADYDSLYSTAPDVLQKRIKELDKEIERKALDKVTEDVEKYRSKYREQVEEKESSIDELANEMAKLILDENREYLGNEMVDELLKEQNTEEGGNDKDEKKAKKTRTRKTTKSE